MPEPGRSRRRAGLGRPKPGGRAGRAGRGRDDRGATARGRATGAGTGGTGGRPDARGEPRAARGQDQRTGRSGRTGREGRTSTGTGRGQDRRSTPAQVPKPAGRTAAWGGLARRAAARGGTGSAAPGGRDGTATGSGRGRLAGAPPSKAAEAFRRAAGVDGGGGLAGDGLRGAARSAVERGSGDRPPPLQEPATAPRRRRQPPPSPDTDALVAELAPAVGPATAPRLAVRLADAARAYAAERYLEALRTLRPLAERAPASAAVRELLGLTLYRLGRWPAAIRELEAFRDLTGSTDQHPVLADCYRALRRYDEVEALWAELREASPSAELVAEGRIVYAGSLADRGEVAAAVALLEKAVRPIKAARKEHHLRLLYVLADLYERAGDLPRARSTFDRVVRADPTFADAAARRRAL